MKRIILILAALAAWTAAAATPNRTATETYVTNKIAAAVAALPAPDYSTNNTELVETIQTTAPAPDLSGYLPKSGGTLTGSLHIKTGANEMLDLYNDDPNLFGRVTVDWLTYEDGPSTLSLWDRFRNIHYDFPTNGGTVAMLENFPTKISAFLNDAGYLTSAPVTKVNGKTGNVTLSATDVSAIPTTGGVFNAYIHLNQKFSVGTWTQSVRPIESVGGSGIAFAFGDNVQTRAANTMVLGVGALNTNAWSFIWNGDANRMYFPTMPNQSNPYATRHNGGFHVNPSVHSGMVNPLQNFWIGDTNLNDWIVTLSPPTDTSGLLPKSGGTMSGELYMAGSVITFGPRAGLLGGTYVTFSTDGIETGASGTPNPRTFTYPDESGQLALVDDIPEVAEWAKAATKPTYTASEVGATTPADVTAAIREQSLGGIWDEALQVWWTPRMRNGSLTYEATTNVNLNAEN